MKTNEVKNTGHYKVANISAVALIIFLGGNAIFEAIRHGVKSAESFVGLGMAAALVLLVPIYRSTKNFARLAFYTPFIVFLFNATIMVWGGWSPYFLTVCLCACAISCLYSNFGLTTAYVIVQDILVVALYFIGYPIAGPGATMDSAIVGMAIFIFSTIVLLVLTRSATVHLDKALNDSNSFRTFLDTTANFLAMVDQSSQVIYVSKPLSDLAGIGDPELARGRSLVDLFPGRDLKLLAGGMLGQRELHEADWEFVLDGQKRYFKAASNVLTGTAKGTLLNLHDMTFLAERDEIAAMKDSLKIGLFFMNREFIIQDNYSRYLDELMGDTELNGRCFIDLLTASVTSKEIDAIKDYFKMVFDQIFDPTTLEDINPMSELHYVSLNRKLRKIFQCEFTTVERGKGEIFILVTIYDITAKVELQQRLLEEEAKRQEEMRSIFELVQVDPNVFNDFLGDAEYEFSRIDDTLKNDKLTPHETLVEVYQSVHAIKSNAVILGLNTFGNKVHHLESKIKKLREQEEPVSFDDMLHLTVELERLAQEKDEFKAVLDKINSFKVADNAGPKHSDNVLLDALNKTTDKAAEDLGKKVKLVATDIDPKALDSGPRRVMKEVLVQLIRNSIVHGIEAPEIRAAKGKSETGVIRISIKTDGKTIQVKLQDDGGGINFKRISEKALSLNVITPEEAENKNALLNAIFSPGFSTADEESVHGGRGIGLNLVRDRIRDVKGNIKIQTEQDKGTLFTMLFPAEKAS